jgi:hypothetical protein
VNPDIPKIHRIVRRALETADTSGKASTPTPTPSATRSRSSTPKPSASSEETGTAVDVNQVC